MIVAFATGNILAFVGVAIGGTVVGYVAGLVTLFTVGWFLEGRVGERVANAFLVLTVAFSVAAALAVAVAALGFNSIQSSSTRSPRRRRPFSGSS